MRVCLLLSIALTVKAGSFSVKHPQEDLAQWDFFKSEHNKKYESAEEEEMRKANFLENLRSIREHNLKHDRGEVPYRAGINEHADLKQEEATIKLHSCFRRSLNTTRGEVLIFEEPRDSLPEAVDWRKKGAVTEIKNQGHCGSCWAFATVGSLEGANYLKTKKLVSLSEQNLVDCDTKDSGCHGSDNLENAYEFIKELGGIDTEASYPYTGKDDQCHYNPKTVGASVKGHKMIVSGDEEQLKTAVATKGPVAVGINANHGLMHYESGVFSSPDCAPDQLDHAVVVVGYGTSDKGEEYWLIKNSWGTSWGMAGYFMLARNKGNMCGVATAALYPVV